MSENEKRFDHHFRAFERESVLMAEHVRKGVTELRLAKNTAYRMAEAFIEMEANWHNELRDMIRSILVDGERITVDEWIGQSFQPLAEIGEDWSALIRAIQGGMTKGQYRATLPRVFNTRLQRGKHAEEVLACRVPSEGPSSMPAEEALKQWRSRAKALEIQLKDEKRRRRALEQELLTLNKMVHKMRKAMKIAVPA